MEMNEQKQPPKTGPGSPAKVLIGLAVVLALLAGGFFAYKSNQDYIGERDYVLKTLYEVDPYDSEELQRVAERVQPLLGKKKFQNELAELFTELSEAGLANLENDLAGKSSSERTGVDRYEHAYDIQSYEKKLCGIITVLHLTGYEDQRLLDTASDIFTREKELLTNAMGNDPETVFDLAKSMDTAGMYMNLWNDVSTDFYHLDNLYTLQEVRGYFTQAARGYMEEGNSSGLVMVLNTAMKFAGEGGGPASAAGGASGGGAGTSAPAEATPVDTSKPYSGPEPYLTPQEIFDFFSGGSKDIYTLLKNQGGYYDNPYFMPGTKHDSTSNCYGDFYYEAHRRGGQTYDMTEFKNNPDLWYNGLSAGQRDVITSANNRAKELVVSCYFRGENFGKVDIPELVNQGFQYAVPTGQEGVFLFIGKNSCSVGGSSVISGDFSAICQDLRSRYGAGEAGTSDGGTVIPLSQQLDNPAPALAPYVPFCGTFAAEGGGRFISDFTLRNGQVYWQASSAWENGNLPFCFIVEDVTYALLADPCPVHDMEVAHDYDMQMMLDILAAEGVANEDGQTVTLPQSSDGTEAAKLTFQEDGTIRYDLGYYSRIEEFHNKPSVKSGFVSQYSVVYTKVENAPA